MISEHFLYNKTNIDDDDDDDIPDTVEDVDEDQEEGDQQGHPAWHHLWLDKKTNPTNNHKHEAGQVHLRTNSGVILHPANQLIEDVTVVLL